ncbi:MAG: hypothetical protein RLZZ165_545 [Bacteroidota bacterium]|jgi:hypothetical protein
MRARILLLLLTSCLGTAASGQMDPVLRELSRRITALEAEHSIRDGQFNVQRQQLKTDFDALRAASDSQSMRIWIAIAFGLAFLGVSVFGILRFARDYAHRLVQERLDQGLPALVQRGMEEGFEKLLKKHSRVILDVIGERDRVQQFKRGKRILILTEEAGDGAWLGQLLKGYGYAHVDTAIATDTPGPDGHDLLVIAREKPAPASFAHLTDTRVCQILDSLPPDRVSLFYGPRMERLDSIPRERIQFASNPFTLNARILQIFEYEHATNAMRGHGG